jgi:3-isopropylmalate/(R)-2-methylmalate dehydratase small subunit
MEKFIISGRIWVLLDRNDRLIEDVDTDQIYHNAFLHITEVSQMGQYALGNLEGWKDFSKKARPGDTLIAGRNFGAGSSRQQAVGCFISLRIGLILAPSFGAIYFRNAVNSGFPVLKCQELDELVAEKVLRTEDEIKVNCRSGEGFNLSRNTRFKVEPMSTVQYDIYEAGGLFNYGKRIGEG